MKINFSLELLKYPSTFFIAYMVYSALYVVANNWIIIPFAMMIPIVRYHFLYVCARSIWYTDTRILGLFLVQHSNMTPTHYTEIVNKTAELIDKCTISTSTLSDIYAQLYLISHSFEKIEFRI